MRHLLSALALAAGLGAAPAAASPLGDAIGARDLRAAAAALESGAAIDAPVPPLMLTPLALAAVRDDLAMVDLLLARGSAVDAPGLGGMTALATAARARSAGPAVIARLLEAGADPEARSGAGVTPLLIATQLGRTEIALMLIEAGADVNALNSWGDGVLSYAIYWPNPQIYRAAIARGASLDPLRRLWTTIRYY